MAGKQMHVSYGELVRSATEAIRGLGFVFGQADDAAECFVWTECVVGKGFSLLRQADKHKPANGWQKLRLVRREGPRVDMVAHAAPLLTSAARVADFARAEAAVHGFCSVEIQGGFGGWAVPYIANRIAGGNFGCRATWLRAADDDDESGSIVVCAQNQQVGLKPLTDSPNAEFNGLSLQVYGHHQPDWDLTTALSPSLKVARAIDVGFEVDQATFAIMGSLTGRLRVPSSDRSRNQAG